MFAPMPKSLSEVLVKLLREPPKYCAVVNRYAEPEASNYLKKSGYKEIEALPTIPCYIHPSQCGPAIPPSPQTSQKLLYYYTMDIASLYPVLAIDPSPSDVVLDMCAAPGGKAFALMQRVRSECGGALALNDTSVGRVKRLRDVVGKCIGNEFKHSVRVTKRRGEKWGEIEEGVYDKVLVDAPCSSDRHSIEDWIKSNKFYKETEKFSNLQSALVLAALRAIKHGGTVVYSTCTMSMQENDAVVKQVLESAEKLGYLVRPIEPLAQQNEVSVFGSVQDTDYGKIIMPSLDLNIGPMYTAKLYLASD